MRSPTDHEAQSSQFAKRFGQLSLGISDSEKEAPSVKNLTKHFSLITISRPVSTDPNDSYEKRLWVNSLTKITWGMMLFYILQSTCFVGNNVGVNSFSIEGNLDDLIPSWGTLSIIGVGAFATIFSNTFCKLIEIGSAVDDLKLNSEQQAFYTHLEHKLQEIIIFDRHRHVLCLDESVIAIFEDGNQRGVVSSATDEDIIPEKLVKALQLLQTEYYNTTKSELEIIGPSELDNYQADFYKNASADEKLLVLTNHNLDSKPDHNTKVIRFYHYGWIPRLAYDFSHSPVRQGIPTLGKGLLAFIRLTASVGIPSLVVILTGVHALSKIERVENIDSVLGRSLLFLVNLCISIIGKMLLNYHLKSAETDREIRKFVEGIWHCQPLNINICNALFALLINAISMFPYMIATAYFYTEEGMQTTLDELSYILGADVSLPQTLLTAITWGAVVSAPLIAFATSARPCYKALNDGMHFGNNDAKIAMKAFPKTAWAFYISSFIDSIIFGGNAHFNVIKTWGLLVDKYPEFAKFSDDHDSVKEFAAIMVGVGVTLLANFWCHYKGVSKFPHCIEVAQTVSGHIRVSCSSLFKTNTMTTSDLEQPFLPNKSHLGVPKRKDRRDTGDPTFIARLDGSQDSFTT